MRNKKILIGILFLGILILGLFLGIELLREQKIFKSRAAADPIAFVPSDNVFQKDGKWFTKTNKVSLQLTSPLGPPEGSTRDDSTTPPAGEDTTPPTTTLSLSKETGLAAGEEVTLTFTATDNAGGSGVKVIYTTLVSGVNSEREAKDGGKWAAGYKPFTGDKAELKAKVPFYVEYLAEDKKGRQGNQETVKSKLVTVSAAGGGNSPSVTLSGPTSGNNGQALTFTAAGTDAAGKLNRIVIFAAKTDQSSASSWCSGAGGQYNNSDGAWCSLKKEDFPATSSKSITGTFTPPSSGNYYVVAHVKNSDNLWCGSNPFVTPAGWLDCKSTGSKQVTIQ